MESNNPYESPSSEEESSTFGTFHIVVSLILMIALLGSTVFNAYKGYQLHQESRSRIKELEASLDSINETKREWQRMSDELSEYYEEHLRQTQGERNE